MTQCELPPGGADETRSSQAMSESSDRAKAATPFDNPMSRYRPARSSFRSRSHETAHNEEPDKTAPHLSIAEHPLIPRGEAVLVDTQPELQSLIEELRTEGRFAYDSEFIGELTYIP